MPPNSKSGGEADAFGRSTARKIARAIGETMLGLGSNEAMLDGQRRIEPGHQRGGELIEDGVEPVQPDAMPGAAAADVRFSRGQFGHQIARLGTARPDRDPQPAERQPVLAGSRRPNQPAPGAQPGDVLPQHRGQQPADQVLLDPGNDPVHSITQRSVARNSSVAVSIVTSSGPVTRTRPR